MTVDFIRFITPAPIMQFFQGTHYTDHQLQLSGDVSTVHELNSLSNNQQLVRNWLCLNLDGNRVTQVHVMIDDPNPITGEIDLEPEIYTYTLDELTKDPLILSGSFSLSNSSSASKMFSRPAQRSDILTIRGSNATLRVLRKSEAETQNRHLQFYRLTVVIAIFAVKYFQSTVLQAVLFALSPSSGYFIVCAEYFLSASKSLYTEVISQCFASAIPKAIVVCVAYQALQLDSYLRAAEEKAYYVFAKIV